MPRQDVVLKELHTRLRKDFIPRAIGVLGLTIGSQSCPVSGHPGDGVDSRPSFQVRADGSAKCFSGDHFVADDILDLTMEIKGLSSKRDAGVFLWHHLIEPLANPTTVYNAHKRMPKAILERLRVERFISTDVVQELLLGWMDNRLVLPIRNTVGLFTEALKHDALKMNPKAPKSLPMVKARRLSRPPLAFPCPVVGPLVVLCEGEPDACVLRSAGLPGYSYGSHSVYGPRSHDIARQCAGLEVVWIPDADDVGQAASAEMLVALPAHAGPVRVVTFPPGVKDVTDFVRSVVASGQTIDAAYAALREVVKAAPVHGSSAAHADAVASTPAAASVTDSVQRVKHPDDVIDNDAPDDDSVQSVILDDALSSKWAGKEVESTLRVIGADASAYVTPAFAEIRCRKDQGSMCAACKMPSQGCKMTMKIPMDSQQTARFVFDRKTSSYTIIKESCGLPSICGLDIKVLEERDVKAVQGTSVGSKESTPMIYTALSPTLLFPGKAYKIRGRNIVRNTREALFIATHATPDSDWMDKIHFDPARVLALSRMYRRKDPWTLLTRSAARLVAAVTRISGRNDVAMLTEIVLHTPLSFRFGADIVNRGFMDVLVIGDTQVGKGQTVERIMQYYDAGPTVTGENASRAGLLGGLETRFGRPHIVWGAWPLNDRRAVLIDEFPRPEVMADLTRARSEGKAEIAKGGQYGQVTCRVRKLWLANPNPPGIQEGFKIKSMLDYTFGIEVMVDRLRDAADIARFDVVCVCKSGEVPPEAINVSWQTEVPEDPAKAKYRMAWVWTRDPEAVYFTPDAIQLTYKHTMALAKIYDSTIPLFKAEDGRYKLARIAAAIAGFCMSSPDGERLEVRTEHVIAASKFIRSIYDRPACDYRGYSRFVRTARGIQEPDRIHAILHRMPAASRRTTILGILNSDRFTFREMGMWAGDYDLAKDLTEELVRQRAVADDGRTYNRKPALIPVMQRALANGGSK